MTAVSDAAAVGNTSSETEGDTFLWFKDGSPVADASGARIRCAGCPCDPTIPCNSCDPELATSYVLTFSSALSLPGCNSHSHIFTSPITIYWTNDCCWISVINPPAGTPIVQLDWLGSQWRLALSPFVTEDCHHDWIKSANVPCTPTGAYPWSARGTSCGCDNTPAPAQAITITIS